MVNVFAIRNFKFLGFAMGRNGNGIYVRVHSKSWKKFMPKLKELSSRRSVQSIRPALEKIKVYARGWLNYYGIASMKNPIDETNKWLYHRIRMCIWKQWKGPKTKMRNLLKHWLYCNAVKQHFKMGKKRFFQVKIRIADTPLIGQPSHRQNTVSGNGRRRFIRFKLAAFYAAFY